MGRRVHRDLVVRGRVFATAQEAARAFGLSEVTVLLAARTGKLDTLGLGRGRREPAPIVIRGVSYASADAVAAAFGITRHAVYQARTRGGLDRIGLPPLPPPSMPVVVRGMAFASMNAAAAHFGVTKSAIWRAIDQGRADRFGERAPVTRRKGHPVTICGRDFLSRKAAARALGLSSKWLAVLLRRDDRRSRERLLRAVMAFEAKGGRRAA